MEILKKVKLFQILVMCCLSGPLVAQPNMFDMGVSEMLISQNKSSFRQHEELKANQFVSTTTAATLKSNKNKMKGLVDELERRMNSVFIIISDATTAVNIYRSLAKVVDSQQEALKLAVKFPWLMLWVSSYERKIVSSAYDLFWFIDVLVLTYGDFNKVSVADRKQIYSELNHQLARMVINAQAMVYELQLVSLSQRLKNSQPFQFINNDKRLVENILRNYRF